MEAILNSHTLKVLKSEMRKVKFSLNYSKLKKSELIEKLRKKTLLRKKIKK